MKKRYLRLAALTAGVLLAAQTGLSAAALSTFDAAYYAAQYPDVAAVCGNDEGALLRHYLDHGIAYMFLGVLVIYLIGVSIYTLVQKIKKKRK